MLGQEEEEKEIAGSGEEWLVDHSQALLYRKFIFGLDRDQVVFTQ